MSDPPVATPDKPRSRWQQLRDEELADARQFIEQLKEIQSHDRGRMAALRRSAGEPMGERGTLWFRSLVPRNRWRHREVYFLIATLFDFNRIKGASGDFGAALLRVATAMKKKPNEFRRFHILIDAEFEVVFDRDDPNEPWSEGGGELTYRLRQTVRLMASHNVGIDWAELLVDLCHWSHPNRQVQKRWARTFFGDTAPSTHPDKAESDG
jgi:CRISPR system Cascade subunit CasB